MSDFFAFLRDIKVPVAPGTAFVAMPFGEHLKDRFSLVIVPALAPDGIEVWRADDVYTTASIMDNVVTLLRRAEIVIADVTGRNPNVLFELGLASAFGKRIVLLSSTRDDIPVDLRHLVHVTLGDSSPDMQMRAIRKAVADVRRERPRAAAQSRAQRLIESCDALGIEDCEPANPHLLFRMMLDARRSVQAVGLSGRSIFTADAADLRRIREHLAGVEVSIYLPHPDLEGAAYADAIEGTAAGAAEAQIRLSSVRFASLGFSVFWVRMPTPVGGIIVDDSRGLFQFFYPGQWHTPFVELTDRPGGIFSSLRTLFRLYASNSEAAAEQRATG